MTIAFATSQIIDQLIDVISQISEEEYAQPLAIYNGSTIGKHFRHIHDFYACLIKGSQLERIDYCNRDRVEMLENNPKTLIGYLEIIKDDVQSLTTEASIEVYGDFVYENGERPLQKSSIGRELLYAYDHAVHHLAIIKLGIRAEFAHINIDNSVGVAASTFRYNHRH